MASVTELMILKLFEARQQTHVLHLNTNSYAKHIALGEFYDGILDLIDEFVEVYQASYRKMTLTGSMSISEPDPILYLDGVLTTILVYRKSLDTKDTHLQNIVDEIVSLINRTLYKLRYLN